MHAAFSALPAELHRHIADYLSVHDKQALSHSCAALHRAYASSSFANCLLVDQLSYANLDPAYRCVPVEVFLQPHRFAWFDAAQVRMIAVAGVPSKALISALETGAMGLFATPECAAVKSSQNVCYPRLRRIVLDFPVRQRFYRTDREVEDLFEALADMTAVLAANLPPHVVLDLRAPALEMMDKLERRDSVTRLALRLIKERIEYTLLHGFSSLTRLDIKLPMYSNREYYHRTLTSIAALPSLKRLSVMYYVCDYFKLQPLLVLPDTLEECKLELDLNINALHSTFFPTNVEELALPQITHVTIESAGPLDSLLTCLAKLRFPRLQCIEGNLDPVTWGYWLAGSPCLRYLIRRTDFELGPLQELAPNTCNLPNITRLDLTNNRALNTAPEIAAVVLLIGNLSHLRELTICPFWRLPEDKPPVGAPDFARHMDYVTQLFADFVAFSQALPDGFHEKISSTPRSLLRALYHGSAEPENTADARTLVDSLQREKYRPQDVVPDYRAQFPEEYAAAEVALGGFETADLSLFFDLLVRPEMVASLAENCPSALYQHLPYIRRTFLGCADAAALGELYEGHAFAWHDWARWGRNMFADPSSAALAGAYGLGAVLKTLHAALEAVAVNELLMKTVHQRLKHLQLLRLVNCPSAPHAFWFRAAVAAAAQPDSALANIVLLTPQDHDFLCARDIVPTAVPGFLKPYTAAPVAVPIPMSFKESDTFSVFPRAVVIDLAALRRGVPSPVVCGSGEASENSRAVYSASREDVQCVASIGDRPTNQITSCYFYDD